MQKHCPFQALMALSPCHEDTQQPLHDADCHSLMFRLRRLCLAFLWEAHQPAILTAGHLASPERYLRSCCLHSLSPAHYHGAGSAEDRADDFHVRKFKLYVTVIGSQLAMSISCGTIQQQSTSKLRRDSPSVTRGQSTHFACTPKSLCKYLAT